MSNAPFEPGDTVTYRFDRFPVVYTVASCDPDTDSLGRERWRVSAVADHNGRSMSIDALAEHFEEHP